MPTRETFAPWARPVHDMLRRCFLPKCKIKAVLLLLLSVQLASLRHDILQVTTREFAIRIILGILLHIHVHTAVAHIGIALVHDLLHKSNLLNDMTTSMWLNRWWQHVQQFHIPVVAVCEVLYHFHRFELLEACFFSYLILALVRIVL